MKMIISSILSKAITDPSFADELRGSLSKSRPVVIAEYQRESPVDKGFLRRSVQATGVRGSNTDMYFLVGSTAKTKEGRPYPLYVHEGTGAFRGSRADYPSKGRIRSGESKTNRGSGGIRPNRFATRAKEKSQPKVVRLVTLDINDKIKKKVIRNGI